jgi:hypothetical protein
MVATGLSYRQIAERLVLSHRTVQNHVQNTLSKLHLHNRVELTRYVIEHGLDSEAKKPWGRQARAPAVEGSVNPVSLPGPAACRSPPGARLS